MSNTNQKRGFVTVATGKFFYRLAKNLAMSYRLFSEQKYPFCVITDKKGAKKLKKYFDDVVVCKEPHYSYLDKMSVYELSPYEETVFIDADSSIGRVMHPEIISTRRNGTEYRIHRYAIRRERQQRRWVY